MRTRRELNIPRRRLIRAGLLAAAVAVVAIIVAAASRPKTPQIGDHWHARYLVVICGKPVPDMPFTLGGIHTQGDGVIHIEPKTAADAGRNASLQRFFASAGVTFARDRIAFPNGMVFRNGDRCPDGTVGTVHLLVNGRPNRSFERYVPLDGDIIVVQFSP